MLKLSDLQEYDCSNAKVDDKVIVAIAYGFGGALGFEEGQIKSVSPKRGDITLDGSDYRFDKTGRQLGRTTWDRNSTTLCAASEDNIAKITAYKVRGKKLFEIRKAWEKIAFTKFEKIMDDNTPDDLVDNVLSALTAIAEK